MNLSNFLEFDNDQVDFLLVESKTTDGSFIIHHMLSSILRAPVSSSITFLVTLSQTFSHYKSVQVKLGNAAQFNNALNTHQLVHVDLMDSLSQSALQTEHDFKSDFNRAFASIQTKLASFSPEQRINVIIDDLSIASLIGLEDNIILNFLSKLRSLIDHLFLIVYIQISDPVIKFLANDLAHVADRLIQIESLSTGYSKEIDGQVRFILFSLNLIFKSKRVFCFQMKMYKYESKFLKKEEKFLYKINERNVQLFHV